MFVKVNKALDKAAGIIIIAIVVAFIITWNYIFINYCIPLVHYTEKAMAPHSSTLAWKIPSMEEPGVLQSMGSLRVKHN